MFEWIEQIIKTKNEKCDWNRTGSGEFEPTDNAFDALSHMRIKLSHTTYNSYQIEHNKNTIKSSSNHNNKKKKRTGNRGNDATNSKTAPTINPIMLTHGYSILIESPTKHTSNS